MRQSFDRTRIARLAWLLPATIVLCLTITVGGYWLYYVKYAPSPLDEIGIDFNSKMPGPLNRWGCSQLHARFAHVIPPYNCGDATGLRWR